ncbi:MAG: DUF1249 domain-containing protein [Gammaproteobacteria bacterium]|nr:DUF1249 domain-containing protein [Gammaproteobacteria bacterium]
MALYEANYIKLFQLVPELDSRDGAHVSCVSGDSDLHLQIEKRSKYTCELRLTYLFPEDDGVIADPDLVVRVYFDARMAEVTSWINAERHELLRYLSRQLQRELGICWSRNIVFSKWLEYLHDKGHSFSSAAARNAL